MTAQFRHRNDAEAFLWKNCPLGFNILREEAVPIGSTSVASTYKSGGALDPFGPFLRRKENTYAETTTVTEPRITFACRDRRQARETEVVCESADVRSCRRVKAGATVSSATPQDDREQGEASAPQ
jgi:hypothetical protein